MATNSTKSSATKSATKSSAEPAEKESTEKKSTEKESATSSRKAKATAKKTGAAAQKSKTSAKKTATRRKTKAASAKSSASVTIPAERTPAEATPLEIETPTQMPLAPEMATASFVQPANTTKNSIDNTTNSPHLNEIDLSDAAAEPGVEQGGSQLNTTEQSGSGSLGFLASDCINDDFWVPSAAIPALDEATYQARKSQAEAQRRAIEVARLNLQNIDDLHKLERQNIDVAISTKENETRTAQLTSADIDHRIQIEANGEKSEQLRQAAARREASARESDYTDQLIALKDQNFELDIQQAQNVFAEKAARYRAQLTGQ